MLIGIDEGATFNRLKTGNDRVVLMPLQLSTFVQILSNCYH